MKNVSGSIAVGGTAQTLDGAFRSIIIQNLDTSENLYVRPDGGTASVSDGASILIPPLGYWESPATMFGGATTAISLVAATTGHKFFAEWLY